MITQIIHPLLAGVFVFDRLSDIGLLLRCRQMFFDTKHDDLLVLINRIACVQVQVKALVEVIELRFARSDLGFPILHLVVVLDCATLIGRIGRGVLPHFHGRFEKG